jgi:hypothetical protein
MISKIVFWIHSLGRANFVPVSFSDFIAAQKRLRPEKMLESTSVTMQFQIETDNSDDLAPIFSASSDVN